MKACVIDDEPLAAELIASYVRKTPFLELDGVFGNAADAVKAVMSGAFDLVFLDINMPQLNGIEFSRLMPKHTQVIFVTAYDNFAIDAFKVRAADYLLKPVSFEQFSEAAIHALELYNLRQGVAITPSGTAVLADTGLLLKTNRRLERVDARYILYVEGYKDYVKVVTEDGRSLMTLSSMRALEHRLTEIGNFIRVHRSFIVNTDRLTHIGKQYVHIGDTIDIPIGDSYRAALLEYIGRHLPSD